MPHKMPTLNMIGSLLLLQSFVTAIPSIQVASRDAPAAGLSITSVSFSGNGCPAGTVQISPGSQVASLTHFQVSTDTGSPGGKTANCEAFLTLSLPAADSGWRVSADVASVTGYIAIDPGATATAYLTAYWSADAANTVTQREVASNGATGRAAGLVTFDLPVTMWSPCIPAGGSTGNLNLNFRVALDGGSGGYAYFGPTYLSSSGQSDAVNETLSFKWEKC